LPLDTLIVVDESLRVMKPGESMAA